MKVWIYINGVQEGPYQIEELPISRITPDTPVWHEGMADWTEARNAPLIAALLDSAARDAAEVTPEPKQESEEPLPEQQDQEPQQPQSTSLAQADINAWESARSQQPQQQAYQRPRYATHQREYTPYDQPKCPPTYFVWSILLTILCCNPLGIVAIITGATTRSRFNQRDYSGARRMSTTTEWWLMITIVTSLMWLPFSMIIGSL